MKIGFVLDDTLDSTDGVQQYVLTLGNWLSDAGHEVHYIVGESHRKDIKNLHSLTKNIAVSFNKNRMSTPLPASVKKIKCLLNDLQLDILHVQMPYSPLMASKVLSVGHKLNIPSVATFHILPARLIEHLGAKMLVKLQAKSLRRVESFMSVSGPAKAYLDRLIKSDSAIIPNPVNTKIYTPSKTVRKGSKIRIVFVGRLVGRKGCKELMRALKHLTDNKMISHDSVEVAVCGDGAQRKELEAYVKHHGLDSFVKFKGRVSEQNKIAELRKAHVAVFPSTGGESFGIVLIEAMAAKVDVVIAGDNPGYRWVMDNHESQLVTPNDTAQFAKTVETFITQAAARKEATEWQAKRVLEFDINKVGQQTEAIYVAAIANFSKQQDNNRK